MNYGVVAPTGYAIYGTVGAITIAIVIVAASLGTHKLPAFLSPQRPSNLVMSRRCAKLWNFLNRNFLALFLMGWRLSGGWSWGGSLSLQCHLFFEFTTFEVGITAIAVLFTPSRELFRPEARKKIRKEKAAITCLSSRVILYPIPYIAVLNGFCQNSDRFRASRFTPHYLYRSRLGIVAALLDSMMADIVEDSERQTSRRSEGLFFAAALL